MLHGKWDREDGTKYEIGPFGYVIGIRPVPVSSISSKTMESTGGLDLFFQGNGFFICKFSMEEDLNRVQGYLDDERAPHRP